MTNTNSQIISLFQAASDGLLFMSESDYPFEAFLWEDAAPPVTPEKIWAQTNHSPGTPVEVITVDDFFRVATTSEDWHGEEERATAKRCQDLVATLKANLINLQVYRLGKVEIDVYVVGETPTGNLAGVSTKAVET